MLLVVGCTPGRECGKRRDGSGQSRQRPEDKIPRVRWFLARGPNSAKPLTLAQDQFVCRRAPSRARSIDIRHACAQKHKTRYEKMVRRPYVEEKRSMLTQSVAGPAAVQRGNPRPEVLEPVLSRQPSTHGAIIARAWTFGSATASAIHWSICLDRVSPASRIEAMIRTAEMNRR